MTTQRPEAVTKVTEIVDSAMASAHLDKYGRVGAGHFAEEIVRVLASELLFAGALAAKLREVRCYCPISVQDEITRLLEDIGNARDAA